MPILRIATEISNLVDRIVTKLRGLGFSWYQDLAPLAGRRPVATKPEGTVVPFIPRGTSCKKVFNNTGWCHVETHSKLVQLYVLPFQPRTNRARETRISPGI